MHALVPSKTGHPAKPLFLHLKWPLAPVNCCKKHNMWFQLGHTHTCKSTLRSFTPEHKHRQILKPISEPPGLGQGGNKTRRILCKVGRGNFSKGQDSSCTPEITHIKRQSRRRSSPFPLLGFNLSPVIICNRSVARVRSTLLLRHSQQKTGLLF